MTPTLNPLNSPNPLLQPDILGCILSLILCANDRPLVWLVLTASLAALCRTTLYTVQSKTPSLVPLPPFVWKALEQRKLNWREARLLAMIFAHTGAVGATSGRSDFRVRFRDQCAGLQLQLALGQQRRPLLFPQTRVSWSSDECLERVIDSIKPSVEFQRGYRMIHVDAAIKSRYGPLLSALVNEAMRSTNQIVQTYRERWIQDPWAPESFPVVPRHCGSAGRQVNEFYRIDHAHDEIVLMGFLSNIILAFAFLDIHPAWMRELYAHLSCRTIEQAEICCGGCSMIA